MARARSGSTNLGLAGQNTNPIASAPSSEASLASSSLRTPQIFTRVLIRLLLAPAESSPIV